MTKKTQTNRRALRDERRNRAPAPAAPQLPKIPEINAETWEKLKEMPVLSDQHVPDQAVATLVANGRPLDQAQAFVEARAEEIKAKFLAVSQAAHELAGHQGNLAAENTRATHKLRDWLLAEFDKSS